MRRMPLEQRVVRDRLVATVALDLERVGLVIRRDGLEQQDGSVCPVQNCAVRPLAIINGLAEVSYAGASIPRAPRSRKPEPIRLRLLRDAAFDRYYDANRRSGDRRALVARGHDNDRAVHTFVPRTA